MSMLYKTFGTLLTFTLMSVGCAPAEQTSESPVSNTSLALEKEATQHSSMALDPTSSAAQMKKSAAALMTALTEAERNQLLFDMADNTARTTWSNLPASIVERVGLRVGDLSDEKRVLFHHLIRASTSSQGYQKVAGIMWLDDILHEQASKRLEEGGGDDFFKRLVASWTSDNYWISFFGDPAKDENWAWMLTGHHLSANFTVAGDKVAFTPTFLGAEPYEVESGPFAGWRTLSHEVERGFEMLHALTDAQQEKAVLNADIPRDVIEGPGRKASLKKFEGVVASSLDKAQQDLLWQLIKEYVHNADHDAADAQMQKIKNDGLDQLYFSWIGPTDDITKRYYYRVHGPSILIEYIRERGVGGNQGAANHIHSIVRDPSNDYGGDWLEMHYEEHHSGGGRRGGGPDNE